MNLIELTTNVSQIFTELYQKHNILTNPPTNIFENALYLEGKQAASIKDRMDKALKQYHTSEGTLDLYVDTFVSGVWGFSGRDNSQEMMKYNRIYNTPDTLTYCNSQIYDDGESGKFVPFDGIKTARINYCKSENVLADAIIDRILY